MAEETPKMHRDFPRWHAAIAIGDEAERQSARWASVSAITAHADRAMVEALVRLAFATAHQPASSHAVSKIHEALREEDDTFDPDGTARELQVLAGACLAVLFERNDDIGAAAALSVATAGLGGARSLDLPMDLLVLAETGLERMAEANRMRPDLSEYINSEAPTVDFEAAATKAKEGNYEAVAQAFTLAAKGVQGALRTLATCQANAIRTADRFIQIQDEELELLWWLTGGRSSDLDCGFDGVPAGAQPIVFAKELADGTTLLPGPRSIKPLLTRAGLKERKKLTIASALNAAPSKWLWPLVEGEGDPSPVTQPIHFAIKRHQETGGGEAWVPNWAAVVGIDASRQLSALLLATLFYRERLLRLFE